MRSKTLWVLAATLLVLLISGCSHDPQAKEQAIVNVPSSYAEGAISLHLIAEPQMNAWQEMPNSVTVIVIQAASSSQLEAVLQSSSEIRALFHGAAAHPHLIKTDRYTLMPGQQHTLHIDRAEKVRQVAIIAGYYPFPSEGHIARFAIPVDATQPFWWRSDWQATLSPLSLSITLGKSSIVRINGAENLNKKAPETTRGN
ncbi:MULTISPECIES: type VI secretion system lipoprotein TssJ [unclassified Pantoea]|uniref:type VI secretion system lipoprotein TssJ n=1 Tax=unclassified Pantoea TaxID=2630326 RepID=UPI0010CA0918|nr:MULTISPECIES: type VI secretion system lipoprotein TssJ [unclassified Pantoea]MCW6030448.1 type VI secretion system lipoprotein TssJ [Pantoea sp. JK]QCP59332.1 type VI secretion system lipoprotein TssJ [Pantoea sp. SO10]